MSPLHLEANLDHHWDGVRVDLYAFPARSPERALVADGRSLAPFTPAWCQQHLPLIDAAVDLLEADDDDNTFAARPRCYRRPSTYLA